MLVTSVCTVNDFLFWVVSVRVINHVSQKKNVMPKIGILENYYNEDNRNTKEIPNEGDNVLIPKMSTWDKDSMN